MLSIEAQIELARQRQAELLKSAESTRMPRTTLPWWRRWAR